MKSKEKRFPTNKEGCGRHFLQDFCDCNGEIKKCKGQRIEPIKKEESKYFDMPNDLLKFLIVIRETQLLQENKINELISVVNSLLPSNKGIKGK